MKEPIKIILIGNYVKDQQESMLKFASMLNSGFHDAGYNSEIWSPVVFFGKFFSSTQSGIGKWFGYVDKWLLFPLLIRYRLRKKAIRMGFHFHVCDHSNSPYLKHLPNESTAITCHDVLAIRGAFGYADAYCPSSRMGKIFQKWILRDLIKAKLIASVSQTTLRQLIEISGKDNGGRKEWKVIYNAYNADFHAMNKREQHEVLKGADINYEKPFILHVGSSLPRKNRGLLLEMVALLGDKWNGNIYFAGDPATQIETKRAVKLNLTERVKFVIKPDHQTLLALYNACDAFIFPSFSEGFGWPVIEAQACGAIVIASNVEPMPEVSGGAALHAKPESAGEFANAFFALKDVSLRTELKEKGFRNTFRFNQSTMIKKYLQLHGLKKQNDYVT